MTTTNMYLNFKGNCEEAFNFYKSVFGGEFSYLGYFSTIPESDEYRVPDADKNKVLHVGLPIGTSVLMGSDVGSEMEPYFVQGNNFSVSVTAENKAETDRIFNALVEGGKITMPLQNTFWGDYFGMLTDKFGISWMVSFNEEYQNPR